MLLIDKPDFKLQTDRRLVKAADVAVVQTAESVIAAAEADAARIREEAKKMFEEERRRGYEKGLSDGKGEIALQKLDLVDSSVAFMESVETKMADARIMEYIRGNVSLQETREHIKAGEQKWIRKAKRFSLYPDQPYRIK